MKPTVQHEHTIEVKIPASVQQTTDQVRDHIRENQKPYAFGLGGLVIGFAVARLFSRTVSIEVVVNNGE